ncbi:hypothetical protein AAFF_G00039050 [Aldrovandia affinis]|uniref:Uncharacterized protein n=1 Tax=Aldrovandia affinis TaxID=143900 RepID=A0AAD7WZJ1_9TELE|nr:hypothetical protein AAFF_G00039050 [Aldrovandia affinis]
MIKTIIAHTEIIVHTAGEHARNFTEKDNFTKERKEADDRRDESSKEEKIYMAKRKEKYSAVEAQLILQSDDEGDSSSAESWFTNEVIDYIKGVDPVEDRIPEDEETPSTSTQPGPSTSAPPPPPQQDQRRHAAQNQDSPYAIQAPPLHHIVDEGSEAEDVEPHHSELPCCLATSGEQRQSQTSHRGQEISVSKGRLAFRFPRWKFLPPWSSSRGFFLW